MALAAFPPTAFAPQASRRRFLNQAGLGLLAGALTGALPVGATSAVDVPPPPPGGSTDLAELPALAAPTDPKPGKLPNPEPPERRVGFALVGLGHLTLEELLPAFADCKHARPVALVSGDADKMSKVARQYGIKASACYSYQTYDKLKDNPEVEVIYIVLPNSMHAEFTVRGAKAGKHILCEKPMANSVAECEQMIAACKQANRLLMIAYRIQYEPLNRMAQQLARDKTYGPVKLIDAVNCQQQAHDNQWRHKKALAGGGALPDIGLYCLNTSRFLLGEEPTEVSATVYSTPGDDRFKEVEETVRFELRFPSGVIASCLTSYGAYNAKRYRVYTEKGYIEMNPAFSYHGLHQEQGHAPGGKQQKVTPVMTEKNQFALEIDHMAECVRQNKPPYTPGEEGLQDQRIMEAIYQAAREQRPVKLPASAKLDAFRGTPPKSDS